MSDFRVGRQSQLPPIDESVTVTFGASNSGQYQIALFETRIDGPVPDVFIGGCEWRIPFYPAESRGMSIYTNLNEMVVHVDQTYMRTPFVGMDEWRRLYEHYTIDRVEICMYVNGNIQGSMTEGTLPVTTQMQHLSNPVIVYGVDSHDGQLPNHETILNTDFNLKQITLSNPLEISYNPATQRSIKDVDGRVASASGLEFSPVLSTNRLGPDLDHFGVKMIALSGSGSVAADTCLALCTLVVKQYVTFYHPRFSPV